MANNVFENTLKMLEDRSYTIDKTLYKIDEMLETQFIIIPNYIDDKNMAIYFLKTKIGIKDIKYFLTEMEKETTHIHKIIFIVKYDMSNQGKKELTASRFDIEIFNISELVFNVATHMLVPKHILLSDEQCEQVISKFGKKIPYIKKTDRICRHYDGKIDQVFEIQRSLELYYRIVVP